MPSNESNYKSKKTINKVLETTLETTNKVGITDKHLTTSKTNKIIDKLNKPLRKCIHAFEYFILFLLFIIVSRLFRPFNNKMYIYSLIFCFIYACTDEFHQLFISGRTGCFRDVLIDFLGSLISCLILFLLNKFKIKLKNIPKVQYKY